MKRASFAALCALLLATTAHAEDAPRYAPAPAWVKPTAIPKPGPETEASSQILLLDRQERLTPAGDAYYIESAQLIQTPEGLSDAATVSMGWAPDIETLVVHKVAIIRAGKTIDVLADGRKLDILRREASLERATLDGRLTATIQPEGLEVGDVLDIAYTIERRDPVLAGSINSTISGVTATAVKSHVSQSWPKDVAMHWQASSDLSKPRTRTVDGMTEIAWDMDSPKPAEVLPGVPTRFARVGMLETSSFADWQSVSRLMGPLYATAATLKPDTALKAEAQKIAAASSDPATRASAALALVQTRIRYFYSGLGNGGYTPAAADLTWSRRFGDCKGKTVLLLALLKELGIEAVPALVSSGDGDGLNTRLASLQAFDHVIVRATIAGKTYWLDGTRGGDRDITMIEAPAFGWALPITAAGAALEALPSPLLVRPALQVAMEYDLRGGTTLPVPATIRVTMRGPAAYDLSQKLGNASQADLKKGMGTAFAGQDRKMTIDDVSYKLDKTTGELAITLVGKMPLEWQQTGTGRRYKLDEGSTGNTTITERTDDKLKAIPFALPPMFIAGKFTVLLPPGDKGFTVTGAEIDDTVAGIRFKRTSRIENDRVVVDTSVRTVVTELPYAAAIAANPRLRELSGQPIYLRDATYAAGAKEAAAVSAPLTTVDALLDRAADFLNRGQNDLAIADMNAALKIEPRRARALANRGIAHAWKQEYALAEADFAASAAIDPKEVVWMRGRGVVLARQGRFAAAAAMFGQALAIKEDDSFALNWRLSCRRMLGQVDLALADADAISASDRKSAASAELRANILVAAGRGDTAIKELDALVAAAPTDQDMRLVRAGTLVMLDRNAEAIVDFGKALAAGPSIAVYAGRSSARQTIDPKGALVDADAAVALDAKSSWARIVRVQRLSDAQRYDAAIVEITTAIAQEETPELLVSRADVYRKWKKLDLAAADLRRARTLAKDGEDHNTLCWWEATTSFSLDTALGDCDAALALNPNASAFIDSRGMALLQLGRNGDAIAAFDRALSLSPFQPASLYARGIAKLRAGDRPGARADITAARNLAPGIAKSYAEYGIVAPTL